MAADDVAPESFTAQALGWIDEETRAINPPLHFSSTHLRDEDNQFRSGRVYMRDHNPAYDQAEALITQLEEGHQTLLFATGMAAASAVFLALKPGDHVLAPQVMYWNLRNWITGFLTGWGLEVELIDMTDVDAVKAAIRPGKTAMVWIETPSNPLWTITDIGAVAELAHAAGALLAVDSTAATPVLTRPLTLGADLVMHSGTKYLNGHSDLTAGTVTTRADNEHWQRVRAMRAQGGGTLGSMESWLLLRGMRTLFVRVRAASASAMQIAEHFSGHPLVAEVLYPGLPSSQGHELASRQMDGAYGGMLSIRTTGGEQAAIAVAATTKLWKRATSLGGVESLIEHRGSMEGAGTPVPMDLLRLSTGIESVTDLIADLEQALTAAHLPSR